jgi:hypothetical protein
MSSAWQKSRDFPKIHVHEIHLWEQKWVPKAIFISPRLLLADMTVPPPAESRGDVTAQDGLRGGTGSPQKLRHLKCF